MGVGEALLHSVHDVLLTELVFITHLDDVLLRLAAAVLHLLYDVHVTEVHGIDDSFCRVAHFAANLLYGSLYRTDTALQLIEIAVQVARKLPKSHVIALDGIHQKVGVVPVLHLS